MPCMTGWGGEGVVCACFFLFLTRDSKEHSHSPLLGDPRFHFSNWYTVIICDNTYFILYYYLRFFLLQWTCNNMRMSQYPDLVLCSWLNMHMLATRPAQSCLVELHNAMGLPSRGRVMGIWALAFGIWLLNLNESHALFDRLCVTLQKSTSVLQLFIYFNTICIWSWYYSIVVCFSFNTNILTNSNN